MFRRDDMVVHFRPEGSRDAACGQSVEDMSKEHYSEDWHNVSCGRCERTEVFKDTKGLVYNEDVPHDATGRPL